jgi:glucosamine--fructose-6-phosphate aminotransferase (isomerizing)
MTEQEHSHAKPPRPRAPATQRPAWLTDAFPELRPGPPWVMEEMIASEPGLVQPILGNPVAASLARLILEARQNGQPVVTTGCGTSEHGALAIALLLQAALDASGSPGGRIECRESFDALADPSKGGILLAVSHEGSTEATVEALKAARSAGAVTILITARADAPASRIAHHLFLTPSRDRSWCHTVAYVSSILAGAALAGDICGQIPDALELSAFLGKTEALKDAPAQLARSLASCSRLIITGIGPDLISARELALKIEEGARLPAVAIQLETLLHGHLAATDGSTGMILLLSGKNGHTRRNARAVIAVQAARRIGIRCGAILENEGDLPVSLADAGQIVLPAGGQRRPGVEALAFSFTGTAIALERLTLALAGERGTNPDLIRREEEAYREAARIAKEGAW